MTSFYALMPKNHSGKSVIGLFSARDMDVCPCIQCLLIRGFLGKKNLRLFVNLDPNLAGIRNTGRCLEWRLPRDLWDMGCRFLWGWHLRLPREIPNSLPRRQAGKFQIPNRQEYLFF